MKNLLQIRRDRIAAIRLLAVASARNCSRFFISVSQYATPLAATARGRMGIEFGGVELCSGQIRPAALSAEVAANVAGRLLLVAANVTQ